VDHEIPENSQYHHRRQVGEEQGDLEGVLSTDMPIHDQDRKEKRNENYRRDHDGHINPGYPQTGEEYSVLEKSQEVVDSSEAQSLQNSPGEKGQVQSPHQRNQHEYDEKQ
jgi:hypothetical protein